MSSNNSNKQSEAVTATSLVSGRKILIVLGLMVAAFMLTYTYASAGNGGSGQVQLPGALTQAAGGGCGMSGGSGGGCGGGGPAVEGAAAVEGDAQKIAVDTSSGSFSPNVIKAKAGVPIELAFSQAPGGCLSGVLFPDFNISEDLTSGGKTVKLPALEPGEYEFFCQMQMVSAKIVVE